VSQGALGAIFEPAVNCVMGMVTGEGCKL